MRALTRSLAAGLGIGDLDVDREVPDRRDRRPGNRRRRHSRRDHIHTPGQIKLQTRVGRVPVQIPISGTGVVVGAATGGPRVKVDRDDVTAADGLAACRLIHLEKGVLRVQ